MDVLIKKLKKSNRALVILYFLVIIGYIISLGFLTNSLINLKGIETLIRTIAIIFFYLLWIIYGLFNLLFLCDKKIKAAAIFTFFIALFVPLFSIGSYLIDTVYNSIDKTNKELVTYTSSLLTLKDSEFESNNKIGMIDDDEDIEGNILAKKLIDKESLSNEIILYETYDDMLSDLYNNKVDAIFVSGNYVILFSSYENYEDIESDTKVIYSYSEEMENQDLNISSNKNLTEPFTVLLLGVDSPANGLNPNQAFNGDTLMLITFNPQTLSATMFSIPRDTYVPIACNNNNFAKINSSAARGTSCVINTIENLTDILIDYYVKINFKGVVDLVDVLNGVTVDVQAPDYTFNHGYDCKGIFCEQDSNRNWGANTVYITPGIQTLNGEQALAYARNRGQYIASDFDRNKHQQQIVEQIIKQAKTVRNFGDFQKILNVISKNIDTNMATDKILSFYNVGKDILAKASRSGSDLITIQKSYLENYSMGIPGYAAQGYYPDSLNDIVTGMKINLELESAKMITSFSYKYGEDYEIKTLGKGIRTGTKIETMINLMNKTKSEIETWCKARNINVYYKDIVKGDALYNPFYATGTIVGQSIKQGTTLTNVKSVTISVIKNSESNTTPNNNDDKKNDTTPENTNDDTSSECDPNTDITCNDIISE